jgi:hypothetical protein
MTVSSWASPGSRLFLVAYEGAEGNPYALALSDHGAAVKLTRRLAGEVIDTKADNHAHMTNHGEAATIPNETDAERNGSKV